VTALIDYRGAARRDREQAQRYYRAARRLDHVLAPRYDAQAADAAGRAARNDHGAGEHWACVAETSLSLAVQARELVTQYREFARQAAARARWYESMARDLQPT
jgi:hypothetical protein